MIGKVLNEILSLADIKVNGDRPWDIQVHNNRVFSRVLAEGPLGLGESYMDGWWDCKRLDEFLCHLFRARVDQRIKKNLRTIIEHFISKTFNLASKRRSVTYGARHYNLGNDLYRAMLDKRMIYTCGYWKDAKNLDEAQEAKLELVCKKIDLKPGMTVLDLGCGWGGFAKYAAEKHGAKVLGVTVSKEQVELGRELCKGLPVELRVQDYREVKGHYDRVISIGILEHVGHKNYRTYFEVVNRTLKDNGIAFVHTIGGNISVSTLNSWTKKYIFQVGMIPSIKQLAQAMEGLFVWEDLHNFGPDYDKTLMAWDANFENAWPELKEKYGERFYRMWKFYLLSCAADFRTRGLQLWQIVMTKPGMQQPSCRIH